MPSEEQSQTPPFTESFNLENLAFIDPSSLSDNEKSALRAQLQRRHDFESNLPWTDAHQNLLLRLQREAPKNENEKPDLDLEKDRSFYKRR